jgi:CDP-glucose 4,6-dehydratase
VVFQPGRPAAGEGQLSASLDTFDVNVMARPAFWTPVREAGLPARSSAATTDKCTENREQVWGYRGWIRWAAMTLLREQRAAEKLIDFLQELLFTRPLGRARLLLRRPGRQRDRRRRLGERPDLTDMVAALAAGRRVAVRYPHAIRPAACPGAAFGYLALLRPCWERPARSGLLPGTSGLCLNELPVGKLADAFIGAWGSGAWRTRACGTAARGLGLEPEHR